MYVPISELSLEQLSVSRRTFLKSCSVLGLCLAGCGTFLPKTHFASLMINDPHPDDYRPVLRSLIHAILPFEHPQFPVVSSDAIESRLFSLFPIEKEERFVVLQKSLMFFNELTLFPRAFGPIAAEEEKAFFPYNEGRRSTDSDLTEKRTHDERLYSDFLVSTEHSNTQFIGLPLEQKRSYVRMWGRSGFLIKRQFYHSAKALVMITAYSMDELWTAIGYDGPLLDKH